LEGLSIAIKTVRIVEELVEIGLNEVCDKKMLNLKKNLDICLAKSLTAHYIFLE